MDKACEKSATEDVILKKKSQLWGDEEKRLNISWGRSRDGKRVELDFRLV